MPRRPFGVSDAHKPVKGFGGIEGDVDPENDPAVGLGEREELPGGRRADVVNPILLMTPEAATEEEAIAGMPNTHAILVLDQISQSRVSVRVRTRTNYGSILGVARNELEGRVALVIQEPLEVEAGGVEASVAARVIGDEDGAGDEAAPPPADELAPQQGLQGEADQDDDQHVLHLPDPRPELDPATHGFLHRGDRRGRGRGGDTG